MNNWLSLPNNDTGPVFSVTGGLDEAHTVQIKSTHQSDIAGLSVGLQFEFAPVKGIAHYRYGPWRAWTYPVSFHSWNELPQNDILFLLFKDSSNHYVALIPLARASIGMMNGKPCMLLKENLTDGMLVLSASRHSSPHEAIEKAIYAAFEPSMLRIHKTFPPTFSHLGWCTWNAFGTNYDENRLLNAWQEFRQKRTPFAWLLLDDGWQHISPGRKMLNFGPDPEKFPSGLKQLTEKLRSLGAIHVGVWHTINGYWAGIDQEIHERESFTGPLFAYPDRETWLRDSTPETVFYSPHPTDSNFYARWYEWLKTEGIDFVKVDNQLIPERMEKGGINALTAGAGLQNQVQEASYKCFEGGLLNSMCVAPDAYLHFRQSAIARVCEDYFPDNHSYHTEHGNAAVHVRNAFHTSSWLSYLVWPDFDMFQSHHPQAWFHAVARVIAGGPVYVTDDPGKQDMKVLKALALPDGQLLRADSPGKIAAQCILQTNELLPFFAFSPSENAFLLGVWNLADADKVEGSLNLDEVMNEDEPVKVLVYAFFSGKVSLYRSKENMQVSLGRLEVHLYLVKPLKEGVTPLGLTNKLNMPKSFSEVVTTNKISWTIKDSGEFLVYCLNHPEIIRSGHQPVEYISEETEDGLLYKINVDKPGTVIEWFKQV